MKKYLINFLKLAISLGVGVSLVVWFMGQMSDSDKQQVLTDIKRADYLWVLAGPFFGFVSNYFRTQRWRLLLEPLGYKPGFWNTFFSVMVMYFLNLFFPRLGEVSRCGVLARYEGVPVDKSIGTMVSERLIDVLCLGVMFLGLITFEHDKFSLLLNKIVANSSTTFGDIIAKYQISPAVKNGVMGGVLLAIILFVAYQIRKRGAENVAANLKEKIMGLLKGVISVKDVKNPVAFVLYTLGIWGTYILMGYFSFRMFPETAGLPFIAACVVLFFGGVAFSLTPGGLGLYPIFITIVVGLYGVTGSAATSLGLVIWTAQTLSVLLMGVISFALLAIINREPALEEGTLKT